MQTEEWPYPEDVVRKLLLCKKLYESVQAYRAAERLAYVEYQRVCEEVRLAGVGYKTLARVVGVHPSSIQRITTAPTEQNGD